MKLYWGSGSPYAWRAMLSLIIKGVEFDDQLLSFSQKEHKTPEFLKLNPRGKVPTLVDGDLVVTESIAIIQYIDRKVPSPPLFGQSLAEAARIATRVQEHECYLGKAAGAVMRPVFRGQVAERADEMREKSVELKAELDRFEAMLDGAPWLGGERVSAADIVLYPTLCLVDRLAARPDVAEADVGLMPIASRHSRLADFTRRFSALPGVDRAHPPHWKS